MTRQDYRQAFGDICEAALKLIKNDESGNSIRDLFFTLEDSGGNKHTYRLTSSQKGHEETYKFTDWMGK